MEDISVEDPRDFSLEDPICIDDVVFYGPITAKEKLIRERFEKKQKEKYKPQLMPAFSYVGITNDCSESRVDTLGESKNEVSNDLSIYESFSIEESKYESFDDSLDDGENLKPSEINASQFLSDQVNVNMRKPHFKQKLRGSLCDSLEDVHSLMSNAEKLSISEEIEKINILEKSHIFDDSLKNEICIENKNTNSNEQNFDDDSLAVLEFEKAFDDSLEETDLPLSHMDSLVIVRNSSGDTEISVENLANENASYVTRNLFENSVEIIYENTRSVATSEEENCGIIKQLSLTGDSLSISENMSRDSLDDFQIIPRSLETNEVPKSIVSNLLDNINPSDSENFHKLECANKTEYLNDIKTGSVVEIPLNRSTTIGELPTCSKRNSSYSNDTIFIEDSFVLPSEADIKQGTRNKLIGHQNGLDKTSAKVNETICIDDSVNISNLNNSSVTDNDPRFLKENVNETRFHSNDTICISDSFVAPRDPTKEMQIVTNKLLNKSIDCHTTPYKNNECQNLKENNSDTSSPNLNDTIFIDDSFMLPDKPALGIKQERSPTSVIKTKNKSIGCKNRIPSPMKHGKPQTPEQNNDKMGTVSSNDIIGVDYFITPSEPILNIKKDSSFTAVNVKNNQSIENENSIELQNKKIKVNRTSKKRTPSLQNSYSASHSSKAQDTIPNTFNSSINEFKECDTVGFIEPKNPNKIESFVDDVLTTKCLLNETDLKLELEVAYDKNQDANTISVSTIEQCTTSKDFSHSKAHGETVNASFANLSPNLNNQKKSVTALHNSKNTNTPTKIKDRNLPLKLEPNLNFVDTDSKQKDASQCSHNVQVQIHAYDVQLLQALDLHDTSYNPSDVYLQSRDSLMPLNLCMRDKSPEKVCQFLINTESKENIPFYSSSKILGRVEKTSNHPKNTKDFLQKAVNKTPKQLMYNTDVKKSGNKASSATKIPVRKVDMFPTPVHQKIKKDYKPVSGGDKYTKSPLVKSLSATDAVSCTKSASAADMVTPRKHHFCMVRNSISRVPKSAQRSIPKKFQNVESPVAKYIGRVQLCTPLKTAHWCDGNIIGNALKANKPTKKAPSNICKGSPKIPCSGK